MIAASFIKPDPQPCYVVHTRLYRENCAQLTRITLLGGRAKPESRAAKKVMKSRKLTNEAISALSVRLCQPINPGRLFLQISSKVGRTEGVEAAIIG